MLPLKITVLPLLSFSLTDQRGPVTLNRDGATPAFRSDHCRMWTSLVAVSGSADDPPPLAPRPSAPRLALAPWPPAQRRWHDPKTGCKQWQVNTHKGEWRRWWRLHKSRDYVGEPVTFFQRSLAPTCPVRRRSLLAISNLTLLSVFSDIFPQRKLKPTMYCTFKRFHCYVYLFTCSIFLCWNF